jgi:hypothetical protein
MLGGLGGLALAIGIVVITIDFVIGVFIGDIIEKIIK